MRRIVIILGLIVFMPGAARADITVPLAHAKLHVPVPDGYCPLDTERARESTAFDTEQKSYQGHSRLLAIAVDCAELEGFRLHERAIEHYISFAAVIKDGQLLRRPDNERAALLDQTLQEAAKIGPKDAAADNNHWLSNLDLSADIKEYGLAAHDDNAVYLRLAGVIGATTRTPVPIAKIYAITVVAGYRISVAFYAHGDAHVLPGLLELAQHETERLVATNPPPPPRVVFDPPTTAEEATDTAPPPETLFGQSGGTIVEIAVIVIAVSILLLLMFRPVRRRR